MTMKRTRMNRSKPLSRGPSRARKDKAVKAREEWRDSRGVPFADVRFILGEDKFRWPKINRVRDQRVCQLFHELFPTCWVDHRLPAEAHHGASGYLRGRSDELCVLFALSKPWHDVVGSTKLPLGTLLWLKFKNDFCHTDWVRTTLLFGYFLPDLQPFRVAE
jgi:hypothetical protein